MNTKKIEFQSPRLKKTSVAEYLKKLVYEYFSPIFISWKAFEAVSKKTYVLSRQVKSLSKEAKSLSNSKKALIIMQKANCFNQSALIQYTYLMAEKHKALKDTHREHPDNTQKIEKKAKDLIYFLNKEFHKVVFRNFEILHSYFLDRSNVKPRICLKGNFKTHHSDVIITVFRDTLASYSSDYNITENTGFEEIARIGKYFLCNNIPKAAADGKYRNPRLDIPKIINASKHSRGMSELTLNWKEYWKGSPSNDESSHYKSTLIIPMTLWNKDLSEEFRNKINAKDIGRTIFGFLCVDHVEEDYFVDDDVRVGYVLADLISNYVFQRSVYTDLSKTFGSIIKKLSRKVDLVTEQIPGSIRWESVQDIGRFDSKMKLEETKDNCLFGLDDELIEYLGKEFSHNKTINSGS